MQELFASLIKDFVEETRPLAQEVSSLVLKLEEAWSGGQESESILRAMKSSLHTIKGNAAMMGLAPIESTAHALEDFCLLVAESPEVHEAGQAQLLVDGCDLLARSIESSLAGEPDRAPVDAFLARVAAEMRSAREAADPLAPAPRAQPPTPAPPAPAGQAAPPRAGARVEAAEEEAAPSGTVRIGDREVDDLLDLAAEAIVNQAELVRFQTRLARGQLAPGDPALLEQVLTTLGRAIAQMRHDLLRVRLAPISTMFRRYARYVRDLARERGQPIQLVIEGGETAVDRAIIGRLFEPLVHMVRNSVAHGIESTAERLAAGKPPRAQILLGARVVEGRVRVVVADDGRGLDVDGIAAKARSMGIDPARLSEGELRRLIFQPGFSTAAEVSTLAGRGVGLEVVANVVQELGGNVDVRSVRGQGTVFLLDLPVSVSLVKALVFGVDSELYALPVGFVADSLEVREEQMHEINRVVLVPWRGDFVRAADAGRLLGCSGLAQAWTRPYGIVLQAAGKRCALLVDWLMGVQEIVVKPLDETLSESRLLAGLTILGKGRVVPVLDCGQVIRRASAPGGSALMPPRPSRDDRSTSYGF